MGTTAIECYNDRIEFTVRELYTLIAILGRPDAELSDALRVDVVKQACEYPSSELLFPAQMCNCRLLIDCAILRSGVFSG